MITLHIDGTEFTLQPQNAESVREQCAAIRAKGYKLKARKDTRHYPKHARSTRDYVEQYEQLNSDIFGGTALARFAPLNERSTTHYDPTQPVCVEEC